MLFFKKNKTILKDLIPDNHIDIHSHLLPGIDDGAQTFDETLFLIDSLKNMGVSSFITTPHIFSGFWDNTKDKIQALELETNLNLNNKVPLKAAAEYLMNDHFVSLIKKGEILTLKDNYVLVEMSYLNPPIQLYDILFDLQLGGYIPVLAHPERYTFYHNDFNQYQKLKNAGCLFQINLLSTVGYYGESVAQTAEKLFKKGLIDFVGSDVHHKKHIASFDKIVTIKDLQPLKEAFANNQLFK
ncbi:tyrosine-protein phosphatase [Flavobacterium psychrophilum]|uniref:tyrosine-protein phosphatase n=1 Tax=Flavobacterium psychrophilum TaxID=96345 RepID=UPI00061878E3|nr:CpsB/CapC family capsule biosynthesis tyrosine phosphatase [Flavobacterium psychrophilum]AKC21748.1 histidinol phosphatase [Flavobacterium psychrophilum]EKT4519561.1 histidinol phosphatase [Flavobacterium psychrophilum]MCB6099042.1 histidinol phosphatase [Flavobacterium psychrophilum]SNB15843.1 Phosphotyrosine protein phosphatase probably involved in exo-polysaccharide biosynthesis [Flavobacterium psychrophilum]